MFVKTVKVIWFNFMKGYNLEIFILIILWSQLPNSLYLKKALNCSTLNKYIWEMMRRITQRMTPNAQNPWK